MKKFELYMGIALIIATSIMDVLAFFIVSASSANFAAIFIISFGGYITGYLFIDSFLHRHEIHHYLRGYDDAVKSREKTDDYDRVF